MGWNGPNDFPCTNIQVYNCLIESYAMYKPASSAIFVNCVSSGVFGPLNLTDASVLVKNCIFGYSGYAGNINTVYENNFFIEANPGVAVPGSNNRWGQDYNVLFQRIIPDNGGDVNFGSYTGYGAAFDENYYILKAGSPAINGGFNAANAATNCGIFGGETQFVYKPSGIPSVPAIYKLTAPGLNASANPYNVTISVRSNN